MSSPLVAGQKRKSSSEVDFPLGDDSLDEKGLANGNAGTLPSKGEYETGRVICESCGEGISFRDEETNTFTVKHWDAHRMKCSGQGKNAINHSPSPSKSPQVIVQPTAKRRRAKRTEEERIDYLRSDPYVAQFEAYRVLCASCDKWIRLRPNSTYCSIPWDAHRKSCLGKRVAKNPYPPEDRNLAFANEPAVRRVEPQRVLCNDCETWVPVGMGDNAKALRLWKDHKAVCKPTTPGDSPSAAANVPPPSKHLLALATSSGLPPPFTSTPRSLVSKSAPLVPAPSELTSPASSFKDLTPTNFALVHESRRRNAEQRAAALRSDVLVGEVEPHRVFCSLCQKWVQLRQDSSYCAYPWLQHRNKCLKRHVKRSERDVHGSERNGRNGHHSSMSDGADESDEPESEEGVDSGNEDHPKLDWHSRNHAKALVEAEASAARKRIEVEASAARKRVEAERMSALIDLARNTVPVVSDLSDDDNMSVDDNDMDMRSHLHFADLKSVTGRMEFVFRSVKYLFSSTYHRTDELTIATLVIYLNAAMPPDRHEDYDTAEVTRAAVSLHERGQFVLEGDVLRIPG